MLSLSHCVHVKCETFYPLQESKTAVSLFDKHYKFVYIVISYNAIDSFEGSSLDYKNDLDFDKNVLDRL